NLAERFASPPKLDPPNGSREWWKRDHGFYLCGPPGHPDDRFELADVVRKGRELTVTVESWPTGRPVKPGESRRPTRLVAVRPLLDAGEYAATVVWREFAPSEAASPFWSLKAVRRATTKLVVYAEEPPAGARAVALSADDFKPVPVEKAEAARLWAPVPAVERVVTLGGFEGITGDGGVAVTAGTFDPKAWKENLFSHLTPEEFQKQLKSGGRLPLARAAPGGPAKPTDPLYAVVYAPYENNTDHCRVRAIEWADGGFVLHVQFFHTGGVNGSNVGMRSGYVVRLPVP